MFKKDKMINRFSNYVKYDTQSDVTSTTTPSTMKQIDFLKVLKSELEELNIDNTLSDKGILYGFIPSNIDYDAPKIGFIAHVDTATDLTGKDVKPQIIEKYDGGIIKLNENYNLDPNEFKSLKKYTNQTLITTDGTTLLGGDDKAGVAEIMEVISYIVNNKEVKHGDISIAFGCDEEIGRGANNFDVEYFGADFAYTIDGGCIGELQYESFNAYNTTITIHGKNVHPGNAKNVMLNSQEVAIKFDSSLPNQMRPQYTSLYEGFYHLMAINGNEEKTTMTYLIREHDTEKFEAMKQNFKELIAKMEKEFPGIKIEEDGKDCYYNMGQKVMENPLIIEYAKTAMLNANITPIVEPIRGGTDGSILSFKGLPCPNIFTGAHNLHGRYEYVVVDSMLKASEVIYNITQEVIKNK